LSKQTKQLVEKLKEQYEVIQSQSMELSDLSKENESHLKSIEALAKQLELYMTKSPVDVDKKVSSLESKSKQEAKKLKDEKEQLNVLVKIKDKKIKELQQEVTRLQMTIRADVRTLPDAKIDNTSLDRRIDELAKKGKIEFKLYLSSFPQDPTLTKILSADASELTQTCMAQAKMMDQWIQQVEIAKREGLKQSLSGDNELARTLDDYKEKYVKVDKSLSEITKQRNELEKKVNDVFAIENIVTRGFEELILVMEELLENSPSVKAVDLSVRLDEIKRTYIHPKDSEQYLKRKEWKMPVEVRTTEVINEEIEEKEYNSFKDIHAEIKRRLDLGQILNAANLWKQIDYTTPTQEPKNEWMQLLQLICKCRDSQLQNMKKQKYHNNVLKGCVDLKNEEILELMTDYEDMKSKYIYVTTVAMEKLKEEVKKMKGQVNELQNELDKKDIYFNDKESENRLLKNTIEAMKKSVNNANLEKKTTNKRLQEKVNYMENLLKDKSNQDIATINELPPKEDKEVLSQARFDAILLENKQNRTIIAEMLKSKDKANMANKLYEEKIKLIDQVLQFNKDNEQLKVILKNLKLYQSKTINALKQSLTIFNQNTGETNIDSEELVKMAEAELEEAKRINEMSEELQFFIKIIKQSKEGDKNLKELTEFHKESTKINKEYFVDERLSEVSIEMLIERLRKKNDLFKQLFNLHNKAITLTQILTLENKRLCDLLKANNIDIKETEPLNITEYKIINEDNKYLGEKINYLEEQLLSANNTITELKDQIREKKKETVERGISIKQVEVKKEVPRELGELLVKCGKLEDELAEARELHFQYEKQNEEILAQYNTIQALRAKVSRLEDSLDKKHIDYNKLKERFNEEKVMKTNSNERIGLLESESEQLKELTQSIKELYKISKHKPHKDNNTSPLELIQVTIHTNH